MLDRVLIGPQLVSPSTRIPTSISGIENTIAASVSHGDMPSDTFCTTISAIALAIEPQITQRIGKSPPPIEAPYRLRKVLSSVRQRRHSAVSPPAPSTPVALR